jgi:CheY-like chemotaxis protein
MGMLGFFKSRRKTAPARILVADDEPDYVSTIQRRLEWCHYEVIVAGTGTEALEKSKSEKPDLILLDTNMPGMDGHEVLEHMRREPDLQHTPVIMVTALCEPEDVAKASSLGVVDYIAKPFDFSELVEKISLALKQKSPAKIGR